MSEETVTFNLELNLNPTYSDLRKIEAIITRSMSLLRRYCGNEDIIAASEAITKFIALMRMLQITIHAVQIASGPLGWAYAAVVGVSTASYAYEMMSP